MEVNKTIASILDDLFSRKVLGDESLSSGWGYNENNEANNYNFQRSMLYMKPAVSQTALPPKGEELPKMFLDDSYYSVPSYAIQELQDLGRQMLPLQQTAAILLSDDAANPGGSFDNVFYNPMIGGTFDTAIVKGKPGARPYQQYQRIQSQPVQQKGNTWPIGLIPKNVTGNGYSQLVTVAKDYVTANNLSTITVHNDLIYYKVDVSTTYPGTKPDGLDDVTVITKTAGGKASMSYEQTFPNNTNNITTLSISADIPISSMDDSNSEFYQIWLHYNFIMCDITQEQLDLGYLRYGNLSSYGNTYLRLAALVCLDSETGSYETFLTPQNSAYVRYIELTESKNWEGLRQIETVLDTFPIRLEIFRFHGTMRVIKGYNFQYCSALRYAENIEYTEDYASVFSPFRSTYSLTTDNTVNVKINDVVGDYSRIQYFTESGQDGNITFDRLYYDQYNGTNIKSLHLTKGLGLSRPPSTFSAPEARLRLPFAETITTDVPLRFDVMTAANSTNQSIVGAFYGCHSLRQLPPIANQVMDCSYLLYNCSSLTTVDLSNVYVTRNRANSPFYGCYAITELTGVDIKLSSDSNAYLPLVNLEKLLFRSDFISFPSDNDRLNFEVNISNTNITGANIVDMARSIPAGTTGMIILRISQSAGLSDSQVAELSSILQSKGWTIQTSTSVFWL